MRQSLGRPVRAEQDDAGVHEEFRTRRKIAEPWKGIYLCMGDAITLGFGGLIWFPREVFVAGCRSIVGQTIRVSYDPDGNVTAIKLDGEPIFGGKHTPPVPSDTTPARVAETK